MHVEPNQLKSFAIEAGLLTEELFNEVQKKSQDQNKKIEDILVSENYIKENQLVQLKAYILGIPFINLEKTDVAPEILSIIPEPIANKYNIVAYKKKGNELEIAMLDPEDLQTIEFIKKKANLKILPRLTDSQSIKHLLKQYQKSLEAEFGELIKKESAKIKVIGEEAGAEEVKEDLAKLAEDLPVIRIVDTLLKHAILQTASDIHIEPTEKDVVVRYRIDGILHDTMILPKQLAAGIVARIKVLSNLKLDEHRLPQDGRFKTETEEYKFSFRISILPVYDGEKIVIRLLKESSKTFSLEELGFYGETLERIQKAIKKPMGMILVTGPTGSGKTSTLYTVLGMLNTPNVNISTIEDPIEYRMPRVNQTQVNAKIGMTFSAGLRSLLRQDPNIIMVGEIRDDETASLAVNAALTGHLVLSTLHTNSAAGALPRLIDMGIEPFLIASTVNIITAQRLVRRLCPEKEKYNLTKEQIKTLGAEYDLDRILEIFKKEGFAKEKDTWETIPFYKAKPSKDCPDGYKSRVSIQEVLLVSETIKHLIVKKASFGDIDKQAKIEGMYSMLEDGFMKVAQGVTSIEEILRVTKE
ncbi:MAG: Type II secretion system protein E [Parcubacteria group bacterium GW2011_GWD2_38_12]|uniref:AAA+ ATPase domain-containing protein n=1 Tax=Candidatus Azambacteria bacterium RIFCSPLOWO2_01_FULL_37_9 TaxID=1797297 RepID=A0A1F5C7R1_9BACT|nr:MAG: Type II secretion system protein E [Parcubacteria group bacterium GW2011_GWC2_36_17]KKQ42996.1 MAG: Type II secretion system protein E [Parcubacteria group bacterium GW2011_GWE2_37_8]KKQ52021.1 MAG: Type II secretion system protein E [Parcubacteria group bacterium GW2011_GWD2_38_12]KKQ58286.1 MAG: Type II secretion system protein E [Parcubacteria group bacterium GW2011_GWD1_38_16]KKQ58967.1 MAG: Type II secretion system protein E [Parcubacteria group bacterium GW2011_GWC1_38_17]OGD3889